MHGPLWPQSVGRQEQPGLLPLADSCAGHRSLRPVLGYHALDQVRQVGGVAVAHGPAEMPDLPQHHRELDMPRVRDVEVPILPRARPFQVAEDFFLDLLARSAADASPAQHGC